MISNGYESHAPCVGAKSIENDFFEDNIKSPNLLVEVGKDVVQSSRLPALLLPTPGMEIYEL